MSKVYEGLDDHIQELRMKHIDSELRKELSELGFELIKEVNSDAVRYSYKREDNFSIIMEVTGHTFTIRFDTVTETKQGKGLLITTTGSTVGKPLNRENVLQELNSVLMHLATHNYI